MGRLRIGPGCGHLTIRTGREGVAARAGHDLTIDATGWSGELSHDAGDLVAMFGTLKVRDDVQIEFDVDLDSAQRVAP